MPENQAQNRRLAAVSFTDLQGYTSMVQNDEAAAVSLLDKYIW